MIVHKYDTFRFILEVTSSFKGCELWNVFFSLYDVYDIYSVQELHASILDYYDNIEKIKFQKTIFKFCRTNPISNILSIRWFIKRCSGLFTFTFYSPFNLKLQYYFVFFILQIYFLWWNHSHCHLSFFIISYIMIILIHLLTIQFVKFFTLW